MSHTKLSEVSDANIKTIKHVFFDLDGTVIKRDKTVSDNVRESFKRLKDLGITYSAATGRPMFSVKNLLLELGVSAPCVTFSGALISEPAKKAIHMSAFKPEQVLRLIERMEYYALPIELYTPEHYFVAEIDELLTVHSELLGIVPEIVNLRDFAANCNEIIKVEALVSLPKAQAAFEKFCSEFPELAFDNAVGANRADLMYSNITRESNLRDKSFDYVLSYLGLEPRQVLAIGDAHSDLSYVKKAGIGVAMGNSVSELIAAADYTTTSVLEDGVALAFSKLGKPV